MAIIVILCGAPHLYKKDMNNSGSFTTYNSIPKSTNSIFSTIYFKIYSIRSVGA